MERFAAIIAALIILINNAVPAKSYKATDVWITDEADIPGYIYTYYETSFGESYVRLPAVLGDDSDINAYIRNETYDRYEKTFKQFENGTYDGDLIWQVDYKVSAEVNGLNLISIQVATGYSGEEFDIIYYTFYYEVQNDIVYSAEEYLAEFGYDLSEFIPAFQKAAETDYCGWDNIDWIAFDENNDLYVHYHTTDKYKNPYQVIVPIENTDLGDVMRVYKKAREMYFNFTGIVTLEIDTTKSYGQQYYKVIDERCDTMPKLEAYLKTIFTPEFADFLLASHTDMILQRGGEIWWNDKVRGGNLSIIAPYYSLSGSKLLERVTSRTTGEYSYYEYQLELIGDEWRFDSFPCPW